MSKQKPISKIIAKTPIKITVPQLKAPIKNTIVKFAPKPVVKVTPKPVVKSSPKPAPKVIAPKLIVPKVVAPKVIKPVVKSDLNTIVTSVEKNTAVKTEVKKKKLLEVNSEHETYFVYLKQPLEYRRHLLESSRKILFCLRNHQKIILIRLRKLEEMNKLKTSVRELIYLNKQFNQKLPKYNTGFLEDVPSKDKSKALNLKSAAAKKPTEFNTVQEKTEMDRLEESLANIEKKLKTLQ
jgi:hypothetical protein